MYRRRIDHALDWRFACFHSVHMNHGQGGSRQGSGDSASDVVPDRHALPHPAAPGKQTLTMSLPLMGAAPATPVQMKAEGTAAPTEEAHKIAADGVSGAGQPLQYASTIQRLFGRHDISDVKAHVGGPVAVAADRLGASAYATGNTVGFRDDPDLHTAAHEAAHTVQQRGGVQLAGGVGRAGDVYERNADEVAEVVVAGRPAENLLDPFAGGGGGGTAVQKKEGEYDTAALDYQRGGTYDTAQGAKDDIGPKAGPRVHMSPEDIPPMLDTLLASEESKEILDGHVSGIEKRLEYWRQTLPDFKGSAIETKILTGLGKVKAKAVTTQPGGSSIRKDPVKVVSISAPNEPASQGTWKAWLIAHAANPEAVIAVIINKANLINEADTGKVSSIEDPKSKYKMPLSGAILELQKDPAHHAYATSLAQALWASGSVQADESFRQKDGWFSDMGFAVYYDSISQHLASFDALATKPKATVTAAARRATNQYIETWVKEKKKVGPGDGQIRRAFYEAVKDLVRRTKSGNIALGFCEAMTDVMVANFADPAVRDEVPTAEIAIRDVLKDVKAPSQGIDEVRDQIAVAQDEKTKLMDKDIHKNSVEVHYIKLYIGIRQAVQTVGEAWIAKQTKYLREKLGDLGSARTWVNRGVNVAWSFCPGPEFAVPVVLLGTIADIFLDMEAQKVQKQLDAYEAQLHATLDKSLATKLGSIEDVARIDYATIDTGKIPKLDTKIFQSIGEIEKLYSDAMIKELG
jgi:hypothetical protein